MTLAAVVQGGKRPSQSITWSGLDLTDATVTGTMTGLDGVTRPITGTFVVTNPTAGVVRWDFSEGDVDTPGFYWVELQAAFPSEPSPAFNVPELLEVIPRPSQV